MLSDAQRRQSPPRRANDEILRRMLGGELSTQEKNSPRPAADGGAVPLPVYPGGTRCDGSSTDVPAATDGSMGCFPSLAMVYAPKQKWKNILPPPDGLSHGSIFRDLVFPLEAEEHGKEGAHRG